MTHKALGFQGRLKIIEVISCGRVKVQCECGTVKDITYSIFLRCNSCGCAQDIRKLKIGDRYYKTTLIEFTPPNVILKCDCGVVKEVNRNRFGKDKTCGCNRERKGLKNHYLYDTWSAMKARCSNPDCKAYPNYGGRGITVCDRWKNSFSAFIEDMGERPEKLTLERVNNNGNYEPSNCIWASREDQANNTRRSPKNK